MFYITGAGGDHRSGLGAHLASLGTAYGGLSLSGAFIRYPFEEKLNVIRGVLAQIDIPEAAIIANSMGAYYLLHSLVDQPPFQGRVLLLSPVLGAATNGLNYSRPPMAAKFAKAVSGGRLAKPHWLEIATGVNDTTCDYRLAEQVGSDLKADRISLLEGEGHTINHRTVQQLAVRFLSRTKKVSGQHDPGE